MEVRCGKCNKLFRVSDDKITGMGIKFTCTRCGEYVKITREEFEHYTLSKSAASALDMFEPKLKPVGAPLSPPSLSVEPMHAAEPAPAPKPQPEPVQAPKAEPKIEPKPELKPMPAPQSKAEPAGVSESTPEPVRAPAPAAPPSEPILPSAAPKKEPVRFVLPPEGKTLKETPPAVPLRSGRMFPVIIISTLIIISLVGYGAFTHLKSASKQGKEMEHELSSIEGLRITSASGSWDVNGDLLITGVVENITEKEKTAWYVVVEVYNAQGGELNKIRLLNGRQLYTRGDYEILAKRGVNIQDLKAKNLQEQGVVIPPKGSATFEMRYVQPPVGIASFNATLQPFDPVRLFKETAEDIR